MSSHGIDVQTGLFIQFIQWQSQQMQMLNLLALDNDQMHASMSIPSTNAITNVRIEVFYAGRTVNKSLRQSEVIGK